MTDRERIFFNYAGFKDNIILMSIESPIPPGPSASDAYGFRIKVTVGILGYG